MARINPLLVLASLSVFTNLCVSTNADQHAICRQHNTLIANDTCRLNADIFNVAIVGSGIAGASAAYFFDQLSAQGYFVVQNGRPITITIYDQQPDVGGSLKTIYPSGSDKPLNAGAESFSTEDWCMNALVSAASVPTKPVRPRPVIRNGTNVLFDDLYYPEASSPHRAWSAAASLVHELKETASFWWTGRRSAAHSFRHARSRVWNRWQLFLSGSASRVGDGLGLDDLDGVTNLRATDFLGGLGLGHDFQANVVEPCVRAMFGLNLEDVPGLAPFLATTNPELPPVTIEGGSQSLTIKLLNNLVHRAQVAVHLNTKVTGFEPGDHSRWSLNLAQSLPKDGETTFDTVVFTSSSFQDTTNKAPYGDDRLRIEASGSAQYFNVHITHFSTYESLAVGLTENFITTSSATNLPDRGILRVSTKPSFYIDRQGCQYDDECDQFLDVHRIDSRERLEDDDVLGLIGQTPGQGASRGDKMINIVWVDRQVFRRPYLRPALGIGFDGMSLPSPVRRRSGIFDINNAIVDTLEMNCRMGRAVAHELYSTMVTGG